MRIGDPVSVHAEDTHAPMSHAVVLRDTDRRGVRPQSKQPLGRHVPEDLDQRRHDSGPPGLMAGPRAGTVVAVEVLVEEQVVLPVRIGLEDFRPAEDGALAFGVGKEDALQRC